MPNLEGKTNEMHTLTDEEKIEGENPSSMNTRVQVPIYKLNYAPLEGE